MANVCVITGGGSGMGLAAARFIDKEMILVLTGRTVAKLEKAKAILEAEGHEVHLIACDVSSRKDVHELCEKMLLCPFEFSLAVCELADVVICDYNYVFDPLVMLQRIFGQGHPATLLVDEAHEVSERVRDSLSSRLDSRILRAQRRENGKIYGRSSPYYKALSALLQALEAISSEDASALEIMTRPIDQVLNAAGLEHIDSGEFLRDMFRFRSALLRTIENPSDYRILLQAGKREREQAVHVLEQSEKNLVSGILSATKPNVQNVVETTAVDVTEE